LVTLIVLHVGALWITSPPDVVDALALRSPTAFSIWGVLAMWAAFAAAAVAALRKPLRLRMSLWRPVHLALTSCVAGGTIVHALLIDGAMGQITKLLICGVAGVVLVWSFGALRR